MAQRTASRALPLLHKGLQGLWPKQQLACPASSPLLYSTAAAAAVASTPAMRGVAGDVPAGHLGSDLSSAACHIGLNRRRDLTMRQDLVLWEGNSPRSLEHLFKGKKVVVVGFPGGRICTEQHIPGFVKAALDLKRHVDGILFVTVALAGEDTSALLPAIPNIQATLVTDRNAGFMKLLGLDLALPDAGAGAGPRCQRFSALVEDGILLKLRVEKSPAELGVSDAASMIKVLDAVYEKDA